MNPSLIVSPSGGAVGSTAVAEGFGFLYGETVSIYWQNPRTLLGTVVPNVNGSFIGSAAFTFTVPAGAPVGVNLVGAVGQTRVQPAASATFTVQ